MVACIEVASKGSIKALDNPVDKTFLHQNFSNLPVLNFISLCTLIFLFIFLEIYYKQDMPFKCNLICLCTLIFLFFNFLEISSCALLKSVC